VIYVETLARVNDLSLTGKIVYYWPGGLADGFLVQWPELAQKYKHVDYIGDILL
jgi:beta-1,4-N-acetylglucosaminyltransferase